MSSKHHRRRTPTEKATLGAIIRTAAASMSGKLTAAHLAYVHRTTQEFVRNHAGPHLKRAKKPPCRHQTSSRSTTSS
jgi:hypothetical protein